MDATATAGLNALDLLLVGILAFFFFLSLYWGVLRQLVAIGGSLLAFFLAGRYYGLLALYLPVEDPKMADLIAFLILFFALAIAASLLASALRLFLRLLFLGWLDHLLGGVLGLLEGFLFAEAVLVAFLAFDVPRLQALVEESRLAPLFLALLHLLLGLLPEELRILLRPFL